MIRFPDLPLVDCHVHMGGTEGEENMLTNVAAERRPNSRLSCQIKATAAMDGMVVRLPPNQS